MRSRLNRHLRISCVGFIGVAIGLLVGSHLVQVPALVRPPQHQPRNAEEALDIMIPEVDLEGVPFNEAVETVRKLSSVPIVVNWQKLGAAGLNARAPVVFGARNVSLGRVLAELVDSLQTANHFAGYAAAEGVILISTDDDAERHTLVIRSYDIRDLVGPPADPWEAPDAPNPKKMLFYEGNSDASASSVRKEDLERLIESTVAVDSWRENGGQTGSLRFFGGRLIVMQTWENHREIASFLAELREPTAPPAPAISTALLELWNDTLGKYVSADASVGEAALRRRIPEVRFDRVPLEEAVTALADKVHADLVADWAAFESAGVPRRTPVTVHLYDVTLAEALMALMDANNAGKLNYRIDGGCVILGTPTSDTYKLTTRVYDIRDLITAIMGPPPTPAPYSVSDLAKWAAMRSAHLDQLIQLIEDTIATDSWKEAGGTIGSMRVLGDRLIVTQTRENQERVADLLAALRTDPSRLQLPTTAPATRP